MLNWPALTLPLHNSSAASQSLRLDCEFRGMMRSLICSQKDSGVRINRPHCAQDPVVSAAAITEKLELFSLQKIVQTVTPGPVAISASAVIHRLLLLATEGISKRYQTNCCTGLNSCVALKVIAQIRDLAFSGKRVIHHFAASDDVMQRNSIPFLSASGLKCYSYCMWPASKPG